LHLAKKTAHYTTGPTDVYYLQIPCFISGNIDALWIFHPKVLRNSHDNCSSCSHSQCLDSFNRWPELNS
jgi:hypothetical protein